VSGKPPRRRARELVLQGLYAYLIAGHDATAIDRALRDEPGLEGADTEHFDALLHGCIAQAAELDALLQPHLDRKLELLSPVEHAALWIGTYELRHALEVPYKVVMNEAVELAKGFGGTDGHRFVNGVLDKLVPQLRPLEAPASRRP
jgi:transcription antitermination protein NusB